MKRCIFPNPCVFGGIDSKTNSFSNQSPEGISGINRKKSKNAYRRWNAAKTVAGSPQACWASQCRWSWTPTARPLQPSCTHWVHRQWRQWHHRKPLVPQHILYAPMPELFTVAATAMPPPFAPSQVSRRCLAPLVPSFWWRCYWRGRSQE